MAKPETADVPLIPVTPHDDENELRRIGLGLQVLFADPLTESLPAAMLALLRRLERAEIDLR
jgi:hypothetical protein